MTGNDATHDYLNSPSLRYVTTSSGPYILMNWYSDTLTNISVMAREEKCPLHSGNGSARLLAQQKFPGTFLCPGCIGVSISRD